MITSAAEFVRLRLSEAPEEYARASHEEASLNVWIEVVKGYPEMREWVAHNKTVPLPILEALPSDPDPSVRHAVAMKRKLSPQLFAILADDPDETVRAAVARNLKAPIELLTSLSRDKSSLVSSVARSRIGAQQFTRAEAASRLGLGDKRA